MKWEGRFTPFLFCHTCPNLCFYHPIPWDRGKFNDLYPLFLLLGASSAISKKTLSQEERTTLGIFLEAAT